MDYSLKIKEDVAVVTGASSGLGREIALALALQDVKVAALARSEDLLNSLSSNHKNIFPFQVDLSDMDAVAEAYTKIRELGNPTLLINNAAIYPRRDILNETPHTLMDTLNVNLGGTVTCTYEALKDMVRLGYGRIVNVTTYAGNSPIPMSAAYSISKGAMRIYTAALLADLQDRFPDIVINEWIPGALNTPMGIPDGIAPKQAAAWGARLALWHDRKISGLTFACNSSVSPSQSWKRRLVEKFLGGGAERYRLD